jgi:nucleoside-diphosphate-sugar epimerase
VEGIDAIAHLALHTPLAPTDAAAEAQALDAAARGMFVLLHAARQAGVGRVVLASRLDVMAAYPERWRVDETWKPRPDATAAQLAPYLAELTLREFARAEEIVGVCLRLGDLGAGPAGTTPEDAVAAIERALTMELGARKYRWWLYHIGSSDRFPLGAAADPPLSFTRGRSQTPGARRQ